MREIPRAERHKLTALRFRPRACSSAGRPSPCNQCEASAACPLWAPISRNSVWATAASLRPLCTDRRSMPCSVVLRLVSSSASNTGDPSIARMTRLERATVSDQSDAPIRRSAVTALPTLR